MASQCEVQHTVINFTTTEEQNLLKEVTIILKFLISLFVIASKKLLRTKLELKYNKLHFCKT